MEEERTNRVRSGRAAERKREWHAVIEVPKRSKKNVPWKGRLVFPRDQTTRAPAAAEGMWLA